MKYNCLNSARLSGGIGSVNVRVTLLGFPPCPAERWSRGGDYTYGLIRAFLLPALPSDG